MSRNEKSADSTGTGLLGLRLVRVEVDATWHGIVICSGPVPARGTTSGLGDGWSPKLGSVEDLFRHILKCFANSDRSLCGSFDEQGVHTMGKRLAFRCWYLSGEFLDWRSEGGEVELVNDRPCQPCCQR